MKARDLNELIEEIAVFCDRFPKTERYRDVVITLETDWYIVKFIQKYVDTKWKVYAKVKGGEAIRIAEDACCFCGVHSPIAGGHLFLGKHLSGGWYINRQGWITDKAKQICPKCKHKLSTEVEDETE